MAEGQRWGILPPYRKASFPALPGMIATLGPGVIFMALAQGSGELIWWPYIIAKYGLTFLFLLLPACLLQFPVIYEIGRYTTLTGESICQGFMRLNRYFALLLWILLTLSFLWFGAFAAAGGNSLAALTDFPAGWGQRAQTLFWAYLSMTIFLCAILMSRIVYRLIETFMWLATVDGVSRIHTDFVYGFFPSARKIPVRSWYLFFVLLLSVVTAVTIQLNAPGPLILLSAVIGFVGTVLFSLALIFLNHIILPRYLPIEARPGRLSLSLLVVSCSVYILLAIAYLLSRAGVI